MQDLKLIYKNAILIHSKNFCKGTACQEGKLTKEEWCQGKTCNFHSKGIEGEKKNPTFILIFPVYKLKTPPLSIFKRAFLFVFKHSEI